MDKFQLIAEVRKRPILWNSLIESRPLLFIGEGWKEVAKSLGNNVTAEVCRNTWKCLRDAYRVVKKRRIKRIERDKRNGKCNPKKNYDIKWIYYEAMKFSEIANESQPNSNLVEGTNLITVRNSDRDFEKRNESSDINIQETHEQGINLQDSSRFEIKRDGNSSINLRSSTPETITCEIHIIDDSDAESLFECQDLEKEFLSNDDESYEAYIQNQQNEDSNTKHQSPRRQSRLNKNSTPKQKSSDTTNETNLKHQDSEDKSCPKNKAPSHKYAPIMNVHIKEEPVIDIDIDEDLYLVEEKSTTPFAKRKRDENEYQHSATKRKCIENIVSKSDENLSKPLKNNNSQDSETIIKDIGDADYNFLISYLPHMKSLTTLQNLQFRAKLSDLLLNFLMSSSSANELKTQDINTNMKPMMNIIDPDCNFLISFWPYMKSLSELQHLQYRAKMSHLIIDILSNR